MSEATLPTPLLAPVARRQLVRSYAQRAAAFGTAWIVVGMVVGFLGRESIGHGLVATISNMLAGGILLPILGIPTMFFGGRAWDALLGAATGGIAAGLAGLFSSQPPTAHLLSMGVIMGALMANTAWPVVRMVRGWRGRVALS
jgi:hypothetical protein